MPDIADEIDFARLGLLILAWLVYFALHSLLASLGLKHLVIREHPLCCPPIA
jgi:methanethiol S-methyltransferase